ncbi:MAG: zinc and cadmium transporter [Kangiellaceae bacterium]
MAALCKNIVLAADKANINALTIGALMFVGFIVVLILEQILQWHHSHRLPDKRKKPITYLILIGDGLFHLQRAILSIQARLT